MNDTDPGFFGMTTRRSSLKWLPITGYGLPAPKKKVPPGNIEDNPESGIREINSE